ncbi:hypothetical protein HK405_011904, partial [Cladochytrium tenue]
MLRRRLFRPDDSAAGVYTAVSIAGTVAEPSPIPATSELATPPVTPRVRTHEGSSHVASCPNLQSKAPSHNAR